MHKRWEAGAVKARNAAPLHAVTAISLTNQQNADLRGLVKSTLPEQGLSVGDSERDNELHRACGAISKASGGGSRARHALPTLPTNWRIDIMSIA